MQERQLKYCFSFPFQLKSKFYLQILYDCKLKYIDKIRTQNIQEMLNVIFLMFVIVKSILLSLIRRSFSDVAIIIFLRNQVRSNLIISQDFSNIQMCLDAHYIVILHVFSSFKIFMILFSIAKAFNKYAIIRTKKLSDTSIGKLRLPKHYEAALQVIRYVKVTPNFKFSTIVTINNNILIKNRQQMQKLQKNTFAQNFFSLQSAFTFVSKPLENDRILGLQDLSNKNQYKNKEAGKKFCPSLASSTFQTLMADKCAQFEKNSIQSTNSQESDAKSSSEKDDHLKLQSTRVASLRLRNKRPLKYDFDSQDDDDDKQTKPCETKNIIKNFIRSLLSFLRKNVKYTKNVLEEFQINEEEFEQILEKVQGKVNTIAELRQLWTESSYNQAFRIMSCYFLRRYYPKYIFHSRIFNYQIHLKYRMKLLRSLQRPSQFSSLKQD